MLSFRWARPNSGALNLPACPVIPIGKLDSLQFPNKMFGVHVEFSDSFHGPHGIQMGGLVSISIHNSSMYSRLQLVRRVT